MGHLLWIHSLSQVTPLYRITYVKILVMFCFVVFILDIVNGSMWSIHPYLPSLPRVIAPVPARQPRKVWVKIPLLKYNEHKKCEPRVYSFECTVDALLYALKWCIELRCIESHKVCTTVTSHDRHGFSNQRQLECMFNHFFWLATKTRSTLLVICAGNQHVTITFPSAKTVRRKKAPCL